MKKIKLTILLVLLSTLGVTAQNFNIDDIQNEQTLRPFTGTWIGIHNQDTLTVNLKVSEVFIKGFNKNITVLVGSHSFSGNSLLQSDDIEESTSILSGVIDSKENLNLLNALFDDPIKSSRSTLILELSENNMNEMEWTLIPREQFTIGLSEEEITRRRGYSVPEKITLSRVD